MKKQIHKQKHFLVCATFFVLLFAVLFVFLPTSSGAEKAVIISEVMFNPTGSDNKDSESSYEYVTLKNISKEAVLINSWDVRIGTYFSLNALMTPIPPSGEVRIFVGTGANKNVDFSQGNTAVLYRNKTGSQLGDTKGEVFLYNGHTHAAATLVDSLEYGKTEGLPFAPEGCSLRAAGSGQWESLCPVQASDGTVCMKDISLNEIFIFSGEFVEVKNQGTELCTLQGWSITDETGSENPLENWNAHRKTFGAISIAPGGYAVLEGNLFLNDDGDSVKLFNATKEKVQEIALVSPIGALSYSFNGGGWKWTRATKGVENIFSSVKSEHVSVDEDVYVNVYANFSTQGLDKNVKVAWDFGDGHGSSKQEIRHKYTQEGVYACSLKINNDAANIEQFTVEVKEFPQKNVRIVAINANPKGKDSELETITLVNKSKKKVNLKGWSIATGWKKLINHPIYEDFEIKAGKMRELTREFSRFSLNNKQVKIELRYPNGEVASKVKYKLEKSIAEDARYVKEGKKWNWVVEASGNRSQLVSTNAEAQKLDQEMQIDQQIVIVDQETQSKIERENKLKKFEVLPIEGQVLGVETVREEKGRYLFSMQPVQSKHYAIAFLESLFYHLNAACNRVLNLL